MSIRRESELKVLYTIAEYGPLTWSEILERTRISRSTLTKALRVLMSKNYVKPTTKRYKGKLRVAYVASVKDPFEMGLRDLLNDCIADLSNFLQEENFDSFILGLIECIYDIIDDTFLKVTIDLVKNKKINSLDRYKETLIKTFRDLIDNIFKFFYKNDLEKLIKMLSSYYID